ncbi:allergen Tha p 1-like [Schistocerca cancellata]|uniref:allergen Tha p 1-like n=1 Tax=Schistocerca cancellata TaxID=274614 RepID=UPI002118C54B|nr:allergen Tha p 1-like [Schistocerca cancellata]
MNRHVALLLCASLVLNAAAEEKYRPTFDSLDLKEVLSDETRVQDAMRCLLEEGDSACRPAAKALKEVLPEIVRTDCAKCTETQHKKIGGFFGEISRRHPDLMKKLLDKYDPSGEYRKKYAKSWAEHGIHL